MGPPSPTTTSQGRPRVLMVSRRIEALDHPRRGFSLADNSGLPAGVEMMRAFLRHGWEIDYFTAGESYQRDEDLQVEGVRLHRVRTPRMPRGRLERVGSLWGLRFMVTVFFKLLRHARRTRPDLIYTVINHLQVESFLVSRLVGVPMVLRHFGSFLGPLLGRPISWRTKLHRRMEYPTFLLPVDLLIVTNDGTRGDRAARYFRTPPRRMVFWRNGLDIPEPVSPARQAEARREHGVPAAAPLLVSVCRLEPWKRVDRILRAMPQVLARFGDARLLIVGDGSARADLERLAGELGVSPSVRFTGLLPRSETTALVAACDLFVSTYDLSNVGNALLEAMAVGACIVTLDVGGTREVIVDGQTGRLLGLDEVPALGRHLADLLADEDRRRVLGEGARAFAEREFQTWRQRTDQEIALIESLPPLRRRRGDRGAAEG